MHDTSYSTTVTMVTYHRRLSVHLQLKHTLLVTKQSTGGPHAQPPSETHLWRGQSHLWRPQPQLWRLLTEQTTPTQSTARA